MKKEVVNKLVVFFPDLKKQVEEIIDDFQDVYLHLIFGDVFNPYILHLMKKPKRNSNELSKAGELIEYMMTLDEDIQEVVVTTILERLSDDRKKLSTFAKFAGEKTKKFVNIFLEGKYYS